MIISLFFNSHSGIQLYLLYKFSIVLFVQFPIGNTSSKQMVSYVSQIEVEVLNSLETEKLFLLILLLLAFICYIIQKDVISSFLLFFSVEIWFEMAYLDAISIQEYPFRI